MRAPRTDAGFTIVEVLVALALLATTAAGMAGLVAATMITTRRAQDQTMTVMLAMQKLEQLRSLAFGVDAGTRDDQTDLSRSPWATGGAGLRPSPAGTLDANVPGYVDYLDQRGAWVGTGVVAPSSAVFIRRWSVAAAPTHADVSLVLRVLVTTRRREALATGRGGARSRFAEDALVTTIKTRKAS